MKIPYLNDELTKRVKRALKSGRKMRIDVDGRSVDVKIGELIGPDPAIERPLTEALALAALLDNRILQTSAARGRFEVIKPLPGAAVRPKPTASRPRRCGFHPDLLEHFRKSGPGWQTRTNETLRRAVKRSTR
jgi:BrnA antitoxin of type II toxin-antitoxin system